LHRLSGYGAALYIWLNARNEKAASMGGFGILSIITLSECNDDRYHLIPVISQCQEILRERAYIGAKPL
tara:strand:+ start:3723 stop:3929 length:207 start_codon:yes stop_codon:yes gene_type:complete